MGRKRLRPVQSWYHLLIDVSVANALQQSASTISLCVYQATCLSLCSISFHSSVISSFVPKHLTISFFPSPHWFRMSCSEGFLNLWSVSRRKVKEQHLWCWMKCGVFVYEMQAAIKDCECLQGPRQHIPGEITVTLEDNRKSKCQKCFYLPNKATRLYNLANEVWRGFYEEWGRNYLKTAERHSWTRAVNTQWIGWISSLAGDAL